MVLKYIMKAGILYKDEKVLARIKSAFVGPKKKIFSADGILLLQTDIHSLEIPSEEIGDVRFRQYIMLDANGSKYAIAKPDYAKDDDPTVVGWPICRMPRVDHAQFLMCNKEYCLIMKNSQNYSLKEMSGEIVVQIFHRGLVGGWDLEIVDYFSSEVICGIFIFCRYMEQENEFLVV